MTDFRGASAATPISDVRGRVPVTGEQHSASRPRPRRGNPSRRNGFCGILRLLATGALLMGAYSREGWAYRAGGVPLTPITVSFHASSTAGVEWWRMPWSGAVAGVALAAAVAGVIKVRSRRIEIAATTRSGVLLEIAICDLSGLLEDALAIARRLAPNAGLSLTDLTPGTIRYISTDAGKLRQALAGLLCYAAEYADGHEVTLLWRATPEIGSGRVLLHFEVNAGPKAAKNARLAETQDAIGALGGTLRTSQGGVLEIEAPVQPAAPPAVSRTGVVGLAPGQPEYRILVVGDSAERGRQLRDTLRFAGFQVRLANSCSAAVESVPEWRPHLVCLTASMRLAEALAIARRVRSTEAGGTVMIAGVTPAESPSTQAEARACGMDDIIRWPYQPNEIFRCLARHLPVRYMYRMESIPRPDESCPLRSEALASIPEAVRMELADAVVSLDAVRIQAVAYRVTAVDTELGRALAYRAARYEYTEILHALQSPASTDRTSIDRM